MLTAQQSTYHMFALIELYGRKVRSVLDTKTRDNYNKIVIHKKMWIPVAEDLSFPSHPEALNKNDENQQGKLKPPTLIEIQDTTKY